MKTIVYEVSHDEAQLFGLSEEVCLESTLNTPSMFKLHYSRRAGAVPGKELAKRQSQTEQLSGDPQMQHTKYARSNSYQGHERLGKRPLSILRRSHSSLDFPKSVHLAQTVLIHDGHLTITQKLKLPPPPKVCIKRLEMFKSLSPGLPPRMRKSTECRSSLWEVHLNLSDLEVSSTDTSLRSQETSIPQQQHRRSCESLPLNPSFSNRPSIQRQRGNRALRADSPKTSKRTIDTSTSLRDPRKPRMSNLECDVDNVGSKELKVRRHSSEEVLTRGRKSHKEKTPRSSSYDSHCRTKSSSRRSKQGGKTTKLPR